MKSWAGTAAVVMAIGSAAGSGCGNSAAGGGDAGGVAAAGVDASSSCPATGDASGGQCLCASAANLLSEPGFDTEASSWEQNGGAAFSSMDATRCPGSGSLEVMVDPTGGNQTVMNAQCVPVKAGQTYNFGGRVLLPAPDQSTGASIGVEWIEFADCHGSFTTTAGPTADLARAGSWQALSGSAAAPGTATAAYLVLQVTSPNGMSSSALFDDVYLTASPGTF